MEAFAKTANRVKQETGVRVRLPVFAMDTQVDEVLGAILMSAEKSESPRTL